MVALTGLAVMFLPASAQSETVVVELFLGAGLTLSFPDSDPALGLQGGADNVLGPLALRGVFDFGFGGFSFGADVINYFPETRQLAPYLGVGGKVFLSAEAYDVHALGGLEYFIDEDVAVFAELQPVYVIDPGDDNSLGINLRAGANYHFD